MGSIAASSSSSKTAMARGSRSSIRRCRARSPRLQAQGAGRTVLQLPGQRAQVDAQVDRERAKIYGVNLADVFDTLQVYLGSLYVNDFNRFGRTYQVNVQAESKFRMQPK